MPDVHVKYSADTPVHFYHQIYASQIRLKLNIWITFMHWYTYTEEQIAAQLKRTTGWRTSIFLGLIKMLVYVWN